MMNIRIINIGLLRKVKQILISIRFFFFFFFCAYKRLLCHLKNILSVTQFT